MLESSLSLAELRAAGRVDVPPPTMIAAADGVRLACRRYLPAQARAALLFYHGGGAHSAAGYQFLGAGLRDQFAIATYTPDIRGHGSSEGRRGDTPTVERVWDDVNLVLRHVRREHPGLPVFLGGHSSGAALVLNHAAWAGHEPVRGYLLVSPQLGARARIDRPSNGEPFVRVEPGLFAAFAASGGSAGAHEYAVRFGYPDSLLAADPGLVAAITVAMSAALIPPDPERQLAELDRPVGLWIGGEDEIFDPAAMLAFASRALPRGRQAEVAEVAAIPGARHLGILVQAHAFVGPWLQRQLETGRGPA